MRKIILSLFLIFVLALSFNSYAVTLETLTELTDPQDNDLMLINDQSAAEGSKSKKITKAAASEWSDDGALLTPTDGARSFFVNNLYAAYAGNVGVGTTTPVQKLDVVGNIAVSGTVDGVDVSTLVTMTYPAAGIPLSTGSAWGTSITNNSANWNTAYGWGNHASAGYLTAEVDGSTTNELQNLFSTIAVSGQDNVAADTTTDTLTLVAGSNISITNDAANDTVTIAATGDFSGEFADGGDTAGAARVLGNNDDYDLGLETNGTTRIHIDNGGNIGIGTTTTPALLTVAGTIQGEALTIESNTVDFGDVTNDYVLTFNSSTNTWYGAAQAGSGSGDFATNGDAAGADRTIGNNDDYDLGIETNGTTRIFVDNGGNVGIGTSTTPALFTVAGGVQANSLTVDSNIVNLSDVTTGYALKFNSVSNTWAGAAIETDLHNLVWTNVTSTDLKVGSVTQAYDADLDDLADGSLTDSKIASGAYFITSAGTAGQAWISDGTGAGAWVTPEYVNRIPLMAITTTVTVADGVGEFVVFSDLNGLNLSGVKACVHTVSSSGVVNLDLYNVTDSTDMLSTNLTIDANEYTSETAATAAVINTSYDDVATGDRIRIDCDAAGTGAKGAEIVLIFSKG